MLPLLEGQKKTVRRKERVKNWEERKEKKRDIFQREEGGWSD